MKYKIQRWWNQNHTEVTWFLIGYLVTSGFEAASHGNWTGALFAFGLAYVNYALNSRR